MSWNTESEADSLRKHRVRQYRVYFRQVIRSSIVIDARSAEEAADAFDDGNWENYDAEYGDPEVERYGEVEELDEEE